MINGWYILGIGVLAFFVADAVFYLSVSLWHKIHGTQTSQAVYSNLLSAKDEVIISQKKTILAQDTALQYERRRVKVLQKELKALQPKEGD